jgi:hypothetical protein
MARLLISPELVNADDDPNYNTPEAGDGRVPHVGHLIDGQVADLT